MQKPLAALVMLASLAACGPQPMTMARAERLCADEVRAADGISGQIGAGVSNNGPFTATSVTVTNRVANPIPPERALATCTARVFAGGQPDTSANATISATLRGTTQ